MANHEETPDRLAVRFGLWSQAIRAGAVVLGILAATVPLKVLADAVQPFAGEITIVDVSLVVRISAAASLALNGFQFLKGGGQRRELKRLRARERELERRIEELGRGSP